MPDEALKYPRYIDLLRVEHPELAAELAGLHGIEEVLGWMQQKGLGHAAVDIIGQDEFNYDFLVQMEPGGRWLAFRVT